MTWTENAPTPNIPAALNGRLTSPTVGLPRMWIATGLAMFLIPMRDWTNRGCEVEVEVHDAHHDNTHVCGAELGGDREWSKISEKGRAHTSFDISHFHMPS
jgi:hypothetical protein